MEAGMALALAGLALIVAGLWLAWMPLGLIAAGVALLLTASELGDKQPGPAPAPETLDWG